MTAPRGKARNRFMRGSDGPRWSERRRQEQSVINRAASAMSAGTAETQSGSGLQPASAVGNAETPQSTQPSSGSSA